MPALLKLTAVEAKPVRRGHDWMWTVIRQVTEADSSRQFSAGEIAARCEPTEKRTVGRFVKKLAAAGIADALGTHGGDCLYRLIRRPVETPTFAAAGSGAAQRGRVRAQLWSTIRLTKAGFSLDELAAYASTEDTAVSRASAMLYVRALSRAGYLIEIEKPKPGPRGRPGRWRLKPSQDTGPAAPAVLNCELVYDRNTGKVAGQPEAEERP